MKFLKGGLFAVLMLSQLPEATANTTLVNGIRLGVLRHDIRSNLKSGYEKGVDINGEVVFNAPRNSFFDFIWSPKPILGLLANSRRSTSALYVDLSWTFPSDSLFFLEVGLGGALHNAPLKRKTSKRKPLGSRALFHESVSLGVNLGAHNSLAVVIMHMSNAKLAKPNPGITDLGLRYGWRF
jgi:lipid A 3-O-deacylase